MQVQMEKMLKEKKDTDGMVARLGSMEKLMVESAQKTAENEKLQQQLQELKKNMAAAAATTNPPQPTTASPSPPPTASPSPSPPTEERRRSPRLQRLQQRRSTHPRKKPPQVPLQSPPRTPDDVHLRRRLSFSSSKSGSAASQTKKKNERHT